MLLRLILDRRIEYYQIDPWIKLFCPTKFGQEILTQLKPPDGSIKFAGKGNNFTVDILMGI